MGTEAREQPLEGEAAPERHDFLRELVQQDLDSGRIKSVVTRFPPEPNGYLHIGHAKAICINFGIARDFGGQCNLRMDDTNPTKEDVEFVDSITTDIKWLIEGWADQYLGLKPAGALPAKTTVDGRDDFYQAPVMPADSAGKALEPFYASDYFGALYEFAVELIRRGKAFVCDHSPDEVDHHARRPRPARRGQRLPRPPDRREPGPVPKDACRRVPRRSPHSARQDRHAGAQRVAARPYPLPHPPRLAPSNRRRVVHLPHVRLRARP